MKNRLQQEGYREKVKPATIAILAGSPIRVPIWIATLMRTPQEGRRIFQNVKWSFRQAPRAIEGSGEAKSRHYGWRP